MASKRKTSFAPPPRTDVPPWQATELSYLAARAHIDAADHLAWEMDRKWGVGRLRLLVEPELRERFDRQRLKFNEALKTGTVPEVEREAGRMVNGWRALDGAAEAAGAAVASSAHWFEGALPDGSILAIVEPGSHVQPEAWKDRQVQVWTVEELVRVVAAFPEIAKCKEIWPGATVEAARRPDDPLEAWERQGVDDLFTAG